MQTPHQIPNAPRRAKRLTLLGSLKRYRFYGMLWLFSVSVGAVLLARMLLPIVLLLAVAGVSWWLWQQYSRQQRSRRQYETHLHSQFYECLRQRQGRISVLDFAYCTQLPGTAAQAYLNTQAQAFGAYCERHPQGDLIYLFNWPAMQAGVPHHRAVQAEAVWAYAEQVESDRDRTAKQRAAWANAKQLRTLKQLSQESDAAAPRQLFLEGASSEDGSDRQSLADQSFTNQSPIVKGRAYDAPDRVITIDVSAVNE